MPSRSAKILVLAVLGACALALSGAARPVAAQGTGSISGTVYFDLNMNGERDPGEPPAPGRTMLLEWGTSFQNTETTISGPDGSYSFTGLSPNSELSFTVKIRLDIETPCATTVWRSVSGRADSTGVDFGVLYAGKGDISGALLNDLNENGVHDPGEPGLEGWQVWVYGRTGSRQEGYCEQRTSSDASGGFGFKNLLPGVFFLFYSPPPPQAEAFREKTFPLDTINAVDLTQATEVRDLKIGIHLLEGTGTITGRVFADNDLDGGWDEDEPACHPVLVYEMNMLYVSREVPGLGTLQVEPAPVPAVCEYGIYRIAGLPAGVYKVHFMFYCGNPPQGGPPAHPSESPYAWATLAEGQRVDGIDIALCPVASPPTPPVSQPVPTPSGTPVPLTAAPSTGSGGASSDSDLAGWAAALAVAGAFAVCGAVLLYRRQACPRREHRPAANKEGYNAY